MFTLYLHPLASFCHKVLIPLYESEIEFRAEIVDFSDPGSASAHYQRWPVGKIPVLHDGETGAVVAESSIIIEYLQNRRPQFVSFIPRDPDKALTTRLWDRFFDLYVSVPMQKIVTDRIRTTGSTDPQGVNEARETLETAYDMIEGQISGNKWITGEDFTLSDCSAAPALFFSDLVHPIGESRPGLSRYRERLINRASTQRVLQEARPFFKFFPYREALPESLMEPSA